MMHQRLLIPLLALIIIASSCSSKFSVSKRRYMKGYHVDFVKNKAAKNNQSPEKVLKTVKTSVLVNENSNNEENVLASVDKKPNENRGVATKSILKTKIKSLSQVTNLDLKVANKLLSNKNGLTPQIQNKSNKQSKALRNKNATNKPFDFWGGGGGNIGSALIYAFVGLIASIVFAFLIFGFLALVLGGGGAVFPVWFTGVLIGIGLLILLAIIVVVVINGD